jgi:hypothetical protein
MTARSRQRTSYVPFNPQQISGSAADSGDTPKLFPVKFVSRGNYYRDVIFKRYLSILNS